MESGCGVRSRGHYHSRSSSGDSQTRTCIDPITLHRRTIAGTGVAVASVTRQKIPGRTHCNFKWYCFQSNDLHAIDVWQRKCRVHAVVYHSQKGDADLDLETMFKTYGEGKSWQELSRGYTYYCDDRNVQFWYSAMPSIGMGTAES